MSGNGARGDTPGPSFDPDAFPAVSRGHYFEDFEVGQTWTHHWGRTLTAGDNAVFSTSMCNWNPMHLNAEFARSHGHPDTVLNPMLVLCTVVGLSVEDLSEVGGPFLGLDDCTFHRPVYPGDTITATSTVLETRSSGSNPDRGVITWRTEGRDQHGEMVVEFCRTNLVAKQRGQR